MKQQMSENLLIRYLVGESNPEEAREVETWTTVSSANARKLKELKIILDTSKHLVEVSPVDETEAWERFKGKRDKAENQRAEITPIRAYTNWLKVAAVVFLLTGAGWMASYWYTGNNDGSAEWITLRAEKEVQTDTLPDGSVVHINKNSTLSYSADFKTKRKVKLVGEAFFDVKHNEAIPFTVQVEDLSIQDIGTAFNIKSRRHTTEVIVESGIVNVGRNKDKIQLTAQQMVRTHAGDKGFKVEKSNDQLYNYYVSNTFTASNIPLWRLITVLNEAYVADIRIENSTMRNAPITVNLRLQDSLGSILELIRLTTPGMRIQKAGNTFIIR